LTAIGNAQAATVSEMPKMDVTKPTSNTQSQYQDKPPDVYRCIIGAFQPGSTDRPVWRSAILSPTKLSLKERGGNVGPRLDAPGKNGLFGGHVE
jgi:hypothetical protein